jgi:hypothetical protein
MQQENAVIDIYVGGADLEHSVERIRESEYAPRSKDQGAPSQCEPAELPPGRFACWIAA